MNSKVYKTRHEYIEDLCHKVADIKYELQHVLDTLYKLFEDEDTLYKFQNEYHDKETTD